VKKGEKEEINVVGLGGVVCGLGGLEEYFSSFSQGFLPAVPTTSIVSQKNFKISTFFFD